VGGGKLAALVGVTVAVMVEAVGASYAAAVVYTRGMAAVLTGRAVAVDV
jgi:hypothetical protein